MSEENKRGSMAKASLYGFVFLLLYVASIGPATKLYTRGAPSWILYPYLPVTWLHEYTPLEKPLDAYIRLWVPGWMGAP